MEGRPTAESKHHYQFNPWPSRATSGSATPRLSSATLPDPATGYFPPIDIVQTYKDKIQRYNQLVSPGRGGGGGLQSPTGRARSSSKVSVKETPHAKSGAQSCHGNRATRTTDIADRAPIAPAKPTTSKMQGKKPSEPTPGHGLPPRPPAPTSGNSSLPGPQSSSVPSTPHQHPRKYSFESREPSPGATQNHSPRSAYSEANGNVPSLRPLPPRLGNCRYETAVPFSRRRMPYSIGTDRLEKVAEDKIKSQLSEEDEHRLATDMAELYDRLQPTKAVEANRTKLVEKLEKLFNNEWPGHDIKVHLFGSSGNTLCSDDSDVDICITTTWRELENVCRIADLLDKHGMEKVVCVSSAKVPIVKIWDPELKLACDMNVNNTLALENTRMVKTYVGVDERVRPLAMIIKYWTRRRIVNDAAFGGTLSSYTWICLIIGFLQLREPPVLPALHQRHREKLPRGEDTKSEFGDDLGKLKGFGTRNKDSLASLLFQFFRFYAHEFDYDQHVLSIRLGKLLTKGEKRWHLGTNNMLCVEEPFNTIRNLGNTADDTSFRGLHMELRRAFDLIAEGNLDECCQQFVFPKEEERVWQKPAARPVLLRSSSQQHNGRGGRGGGFRGGRHPRNGNSRRASSSVAHEANPSFPQAGMVAAPMPIFTEYGWYHPMSPELLHALTTETYRNMFPQPANMTRIQAGQGQSADRSRTNSINVENTPLSAPLRQELFYTFPMQLQSTPYGFHPGFGTFPSSPATTTAPAEFRRALHRGTVASDSGSSNGSGALRSQSQPALRTPMSSAPSIPGYPTVSQPAHGVGLNQHRQSNGTPIPFLPDDHKEAGLEPTKSSSDSPPEDDVPRFAGYYLRGDSSSPPRKVNGFNGALPTANDGSQGGPARRRLSTDLFPRGILDQRMKRTSRSPSPLGHTAASPLHNRSISVSAPLTSGPFSSNGSLAPTRPLVVNGSNPKQDPALGSARPVQMVENHLLENLSLDNPLYINQGHGYAVGWMEPSVVPINVPEPSPSRYSERPVVVNGSSARSPTSVQGNVDATFQHRVATGMAPNGVLYAPVVGEAIGSSGFQSPPAGRSQGMSRQHQNGITPLDLATGDFTAVQDMQHLSPVYENRTPSPTAVRRFDSQTVVQSPGATVDRARADVVKGAPKPAPTGPSAKHDGSSRSPVLDSRLNGAVNGAARENGHVRGSKSQSENIGGWQKQKPRKKGSAETKGAANESAHREQLPKNDADRKGG
ncbi:hypothetical protein OQA88_4768 [Cercophora sp. LCS_1]